MPMTHTFREKMEYLVKTTGHAETEIVAEAIEKGLSELYRERVADSYLAGKLDRKQAVTELGEEAVEDLDYASRAIEKDVQWGLHG